LPVSEGEERDEFVFTGVWFDGLAKLPEDSELDNAYWAEILAVKAEVNKALEAARKEKKVGKALEASVILHATADLVEKLSRLSTELRFVLITSSAAVELVKSAPEGAIETEVNGLWLSVEQAAGSKCDRCWHFTDDVGQHAEHPSLCGRCITNVDGEGEKRQFA